LTAAISLPCGVGIGLLVTSYPNRAATVIGTAASLMRVLSVYIIGIAAFNLVRQVGALSGAGLASDLLRGYHIDPVGGHIPGQGSFFAAALFLSTLAIPVVARAAEEGFRSLPVAIREGALALGASDGYTLLRILLPWALPNVVTGLLIGCAE